MVSLLSDKIKITLKGVVEDVKIVGVRWGAKGKTGLEGVWAGDD